MCSLDGGWRKFDEIQHRIFQHINNADQIILWLNLLFLFCITLIPFQTSLIIQYPESRVAVIFYALTQAFAGFVFVLLWYYATKDRRFSDPDLSQVTVRYYTVRGLLSSGSVLHLNWNCCI